MNTRRFLFIFLLSFFTKNIMAQISPAPWKPDQMVATAALAATLKTDHSNKMLIINVGPSGQIKNAVNIGPAREKANADKLKDLLAKEKKDREIIVYCGCCPYKNCPNIRPAYALLDSLRFTNFKLLDIPKNLKADWIDVGYPMNN